MIKRKVGEKTGDERERKRGITKKKREERTGKEIKRIERIKGKKTSKGENREK